MASPRAIAACSAGDDAEEFELMNSDFVLGGREDMVGLRRGYRRVKDLYPLHYCHLRRPGRDVS